MLPMQGVQVQSLVGELRSHMPWGTEKKKETGLEKKEKGLKKKKKDSMEAQTKVKGGFLE